MNKRLAMQSTRRAALCLAGIALPGAVQAQAGAASQATSSAFAPPEVRLLNRHVRGVELQVEGHSAAGGDHTVASRNARRGFCEQVLRLPYINDTPLGELGRLRERRVLLEGEDYAWAEMQVLRPGSMCHVELVTRRTLTVSRIEGDRRWQTTFDYRDRTFRRMEQGSGPIARGIVMGLSPSTRSLQAAGWTAGGRRVIAGLPCIDYRHPAHTPTSQFTQCITAEHPVRGRRLPLVLAMLMGHPDRPLMRWEVTAVLPEVEVDMGIFDGPPGFRDATPPRPAPADEGADPRSGGRR